MAEAYTIQAGIDIRQNETDIRQADWHGHKNRSKYRQTRVVERQLQRQTAPNRWQRHTSKEGDDQTGIQ